MYVLSVPNTTNARLAKKLIKLEPSLAKMTKYNVKIVEKSGIQLSRLFQRVYSPNTCQWSSCYVCSNSDEGRRSKCRVANVVYEAKCMECVQRFERGEIEEKEIGIYVGETSRTLLERVTEHVTAAENVDIENFITKHWALKHKSLESFPTMKFRVLKQCKDALTRQVSEAIWIENCGNMNSRSEWGRNSLTRLRVDKDSGAKERREEARDSELNEDVLNAFKEERKKNSNARRGTQPDLSPIGSVDEVRVNTRTKSMKRVNREIEEEAFPQQRTRAIKKRKLSCSDLPVDLIGGGGKDEVPVEGTKNATMERGDNEDPVGGNEKDYTAPLFERGRGTSISFLSHRVLESMIPTFNTTPESSISHTVVLFKEDNVTLIKAETCAEKMEEAT